MQKHLIVITGPTGVGKTRVTIELAIHYGSEIVSADSRQIYKEFYIGTATPSASELQQAKHHLIQTHSISDTYNASIYEDEAIKVIEELFRKNDIVFLTGGSMLYIDAVCKGIDEMPDVDPDIRLNLKQKFADEGIESMRLQLKQLDPEYYRIVDLKNPARIIHALEVCLGTGKTFSSFRTNPRKVRTFSIVKIGLDCDRADLHRKINSRVDKMISDGLAKEVQNLKSYRNMTALNTVGYRELFDYFDGKTNFETAVELIKRNTRRYARKQLTWFRNDPDVSWFHPDDISSIVRHIDFKTKISK